MPVSEGSQRSRYARSPSPSCSLVLDLKWPRFSYKIIQITVSSWITPNKYNSGQPYVKMATFIYPCLPFVWRYAMMFSSVDELWSWSHALPFASRGMRRLGAKCRCLKTKGFRKRGNWINNCVLSSSAFRDFPMGRAHGGQVCGVGELYHPGRMREAG